MPKVPEFFVPYRRFQLSQTPVANRRRFGIFFLSIYLYIFTVQHHKKSLNPGQQVLTLMFSECPEYFMCI